MATLFGVKRIFYFVLQHILNTVKTACPTRDMKEAAITCAAQGRMCAHLIRIAENVAVAPTFISLAYIKEDKAEP